MTDNSEDAPPVNNVAPILSPDQGAMVQHLQLLFGRATDGRLEITGLGPSKRVRTKFFPVDQTDEASEYALTLNLNPGCNVYVGAALRHDDVFPGQAADDADFLKTYVVWADADSEDEVASARSFYREKNITPPVVVVTGRTPTKRAQFWWPLETPIDDITVLRPLLRGMSVAMGTDPKVCTGKQLMRLAGSLAWPTKEGRVLERTELVFNSDAQREFLTEQIQRAFPPNVVSIIAPISDVIVAPSGSLGLTEKVMDGRETYAFKLVRANLREWIGTTGCEPTADELYKQTAPIYLKKADQVRIGRGPDFLKSKCIEAIRALQSGQIPGMRTLDKAVIGWAEKHPQRDEEDDEFSPPDLGPEEIEESPFRASDLKGDPPERKWVVKDWIVERAVNSLYGDGGLGKTLLAQQLACAVSLGAPWLGLETAKGSVLAVLCEDDKGELHRRHNDIKASMGHGVGNPFHDVWLWPRVGSDNLIIQWDKSGDAKLGKFAKLLVDQIEKLAPSLVILDTLADFYGGNEIDRSQVNYFVKTVLGGLIKKSEIPLTILLLGHPSVAGMASGSGFSGSTAWNNAVRSRMWLTKPEEGASEERIITREKSNYAASGAETAVRLVYAEGVLHAENVVKEDDSMLWAAREKVVEIVNRAWRSDRPFMAKKGAPRYIYTDLVPEITRDGYAPNMVRQAIRECIEAGDINTKPSNGKRGYHGSTT